MLLRVMLLGQLREACFQMAVLRVMMSSSLPSILAWMWRVEEFVEEVIFFALSSRGTVEGQEMSVGSM